jgi:alpha/beta superfamily hydrolase
LEAVLRLPDRAVRGSAVLCHPHPKYGGSKDHPLLWAIAAELSRRGLAVVSFNFRGVMGSEGAHEGGVGELQDARAAVTSALDHTGPPMLLVGWSFGANVALREAVADPRVDALALVAVPLAWDRRERLPELPTNDVLTAYERPVLLAAGDRDPFCPEGELRLLARKLSDARLFVAPGADHYFAKREREAAQEIAAFAEDRLPLAT